MPVGTWCPKRGTGNDLEVVARFSEIRFEFILNVNNESGCYRREQTNLFPREIGTTPAVDAERKTLKMINVAFESSPYLFMKSRSYRRLTLKFVADAGAAGHSKEVRKEGW